MIKILFICHGNICRSPMAEFVLKDLVKKAGLEDQFFIASAATSTEEIGNPVQLKRPDYPKYDFFLGMDHWNIRNMVRMLGGDPDGKVHLLLDYSRRSGEEIADPWYTGNFEVTYTDILEGCQGFLAYCGAQGLLA